MDKIIRYHIIVADRVAQMLASHMLFLAQKSPSAAHETRKRLMTAIRSLSDMPQRYPFFDADFIPLNKYHRMYVEKWYLVLFQIRDNTVYVDYLLDCRQDYQWLV